MGSPGELESATDSFRGFCAVHGEGAPCPSSIQQRPLLTLPTSCQGPEETFYEAFSWEGSEDLGSAVTHDSMGNPLGISGCHRLSFSPFSRADPTTAEAKSPSGLDVSVAFVDEGLAHYGGIAESQVRDIALALFGGMTIGPKLASATGSCSEAASKPRLRNRRAVRQPRA